MIENKLPLKLLSRTRIIILMFVLFLVSGCLADEYPKAFATLILPKSDMDDTANISVEGDIRRSRPISILYSSFFELTQTDPPEQRRMRLNLFPLTTLRVEFDEPIFDHANAYTQSGRIVGEPFSEVTLAVNGETIAINIRCAKGIFYVRDVGQYHMVYQMEEKYPDIATITDQMEDTSLLEPVQASPPQIDVMVIYSTAAKNAAGGSANLQNLIVLAAAEVNQGFSNSGIAPRISLVKMQEVSTEPTSYPNGLYCVTEKNDGCLDSIHTLRDQNYADIVLYIVNNNTYCGLSWMLTKFNGYSERNGFALVNWRCAANQYGMAREIGHLLGAQMDRAAAGYDQGAFSYSYGFQSPNKNFRTIMATDCAPTSCPRINYWSNPNISINGIPTGIYYQSANAADNRRTINTTAQWVSDFRTPPSPPDQVTLLTPENNSAHLTAPVIYAWVPETGATAYKIIISRVSSGMVELEEVINAEAVCTDQLCTYSPMVSLSPNDFYWQVAGINSIGMGEFSETNKFSIQLQPPTLVWPGNFTNTNAKKPVFEWKKLSNSPAYEVQLTTESGTVIFSTVVSRASACVDDFCSYKAISRLAVGEYKWRVRGKKTIEGFWSVYNKFSVTQLQSPTPFAPLQNTIVTDPNATFDWQPLPAVGMYQIVITNLADGTKYDGKVYFYKDCTSEICSYQPANPLSYGTYTWKIRGFSEMFPGDWSPLQTFSIGRLSAPKLLSPSDSSTFTSVQPSFSWNTLENPDIDHYELQIRDSANNIVRTQVIRPDSCSNGVCMTDAPPAFTEESYRWRVRAWNATDYGFWSEYWQFSISTSIPTPRLRYPWNTTIIYSPRLTFRWYPLQNVTSYRLWLETSAGQKIGEWEIGLSACEGKTYCEFPLPQNLPVFGIYRWKVLATRGETNGSWSTTRKFSYQQLQSTTLIAPESGEQISNSQPTFQWTVVPGAAIYQLQIRDLDDNVIASKLVPASDCASSICNYVLPTHLSNGEYQWRVRGENEINDAPWSNNWIFTIMSDTVLKFYFNDGAPGWINPNQRWYIHNGWCYRGEPGTQTFFSAITYYDQVYSNATLKARVRSRGTNAADGFSLVLRSEFSESGAILRGYTIDIEGTPAGLRLSGWRVSTAAASTSAVVDKPAAVEIQGFDITLFHTYELAVYGNEAALLIDGKLEYTMPIDPLFSSGHFGFDVISTHDSDHFVDINWATIEYE